MDMLIDPTISSVISVTMGSVVGWIVGRARQKREVRRLDIDNIDAATETWKKVVDALEEQIEKLVEQRRQDSQQIFELTTEVLSLRSQVTELQSGLTLMATTNQDKIDRYEKLLSDNGIAF